MEQAILNLEHLSKSFDGKKILDDLSIDIGKNEFVTLLGQMCIRDSNRKQQLFSKMGT